MGKQQLGGKPRSKSRVGPVVLVPSTPRNLNGKIAKYEVNDIDRQIVIDATAAGLSQLDTAGILGMSLMTLRKYYLTELHTAKASMDQRIAGSLMQKALSGNLAAQMFYLRTKARWSETVKLGGDEGNPVQVEHKANTAQMLKDALMQLAEVKRLT